MKNRGKALTVEAVVIEGKSSLYRFGNWPMYFAVEYENDMVLRVKCKEAKHNLVRILRYLEDPEISFGRVYSELPTLNDVFLEITGKELRD